MTDLAASLPPAYRDPAAAAQALRGEIETGCASVERDRRLPAGVVAVLNDAGLLALTIPAAYGGAETPPAQIYEAIQETAYADSAAGWCLMIYLTAGVTAAGLPEAWAREIFAVGARTPVVAGASAPMGRARPVEGGWEVSGRWTWGSGSHHADWMFGGVIVEEDGDMRRAPNGMPLVYAAAFSRDQFRLHDNWDPSGLRGTGSVDFEVDGAFVPEGRWIVNGLPHLTVDTPLYRFPFFGFFAGCVAAVPIGIARRALDDFTALAQKKVPAWRTKTIDQSALVQFDLARAEALVEGGRRYLAHATEEIFDKVRAGDAPTLADRRTLRLAASQATKMAAEAVDIVYAAGGGTSLQSGCSLQRHFRDIHAATQHIMVHQNAWRTLGATRLFDDLPDAAMV